MATQWVNFNSSDKGKESDKAIEYNIGGMGHKDKWVWIPKSCLQVIKKGAFEITQIKKWIVYRNNWQSFIIYDKAYGY